MNESDRRLIEEAFPLKQASLDSVHEKSVNHGHISTMHIWPARRPLAACRAALIATLLPDPEDEDERRKLVKKIGGELTEKTTRSGNVKEATEGGVLHWKRESSPLMDEFREQIREAFDGRAPRVLDPFAGGGAIPLEAMRLGCDTTAIDLNPVAWFILKCTLDYPQRLAGKDRPLPDFALQNPDFMDTYFKKETALTRTKRERQMKKVRKGSFEFKNGGLFDSKPESADFSWHVRVWGHWVLENARKDLAEFYPTYAEFETAESEPTPHLDELRKVPLREDGTADVDQLSAEFGDDYLSDETNPRWVAKPTVAYLSARTVPCKSCRATLPLLKTQWLCRKGDKRIRLTIEPKDDESGVEFGIERGVPKGVDRSLTNGTMSRSGATCPCCGTVMTKEDIRQEGQTGRIESQMTAVVMDGQSGKEYRLPTDEERYASEKASEKLDELYSDIPFGFPDEETPRGGKGASRAFSIRRYGFENWKDLFTARQLLALGSLIKHARSAREAMRDREYEKDWVTTVSASLSLMIDRLSNQCSSLARWNLGGEKIEGVFDRFTLSMLWDFAEVNPLGERSGAFTSAIDWVSRANGHLNDALQHAGPPDVLQQSAVSELENGYDAVVTDPPYYDAIPYSDTMDYFHVWLRRSTHGLSDEVDEVFSDPLAPKWDHEEQDGELIDDPGRFDGEQEESKEAYEEGLFRSFQSCYGALGEEGRLCIVFANKKPDAWETLVSAVIRAGFVVDASWPIETERAGRTRSHSSAALSSSIWLVCRKRSESVRPGWDSSVIDEMKNNITERLRQFWDAGIRGPDFVWAATGPALEAYSKHPVVKKADEPGKTMEVGEFLEHVRQEVVDFAVGRVMSQNGEEEDTAGLDSVTAYYLLHRNDYGLEKAPAGAGILYALSCGLDDSALSGRYDLVEQSGSKVSLKSWEDREKDSLGKGTDAPLIDQIHRLARLWSTGDKNAVNAYIDDQGLQKNAQFQRVLQALIELSESKERRILESISNHLKRQSQQSPSAGDRQTEMFGQ
jgi:adenine-specific DNA methylase